jgi:hypothetical protein
MGQIVYNGIWFDLNKVYIRIPSDHRIANLGFSAEMAFEAISEK